MNRLENMIEDEKEYEHLRKKLENRRLDFDAKLNQIQKAKSKRICIRNFE